MSRIGRKQTKERRKKERGTISVGKGKVSGIREKVCKEDEKLKSEKEVRK